MAKRGPQSEMNHTNWDQEEEPEEAGVFKQATKDIIQQRVIKKAKRRGPDEGGDIKTGAFGGFGGLMMKPASMDKPSEVKGFSFSVSSASSLSSTSSKSSLTTGGATSSSENTENSAKDDSKESSYLSELRSLNEGVLDWIKQHVDKNPYILLTPVFKDYEKYLAGIKSKEVTTNGSSTEHKVSSPAKHVGFGLSSKSSEETTTNGFAFSKTATTSSGFNFGSSATTTTSSAPSAASTGFSFGSSTEGATTASTTSVGFSFGSTTAATSAPAGGFSFGSSTTAATSSATSGGFSFGSSTATASAAPVGFSFGASTAATTTSSFGNSGFSFGTLAAKTMATTQAGSSQGGDDEEYVPPKPEVKEIAEEGSLYSKRCKLFYQKEGQWTERGVGNVHLKPVDESKTQLLVRADTNLGNILLNVMVSSGLPASRQGKNNILLVCIPNPPLKEGKDEQKAIPMLIRVKTGDEADELLAKIEERKALL